MRLLLTKLLVVGAGLAACASEPIVVKASSSAFAFVNGSCSAEVAAAGGRCGTLSVPENWAASDGRRIDLNVIVLPAIAGEPRPPIFDVDGGPGLPATKNAGFYLTFGAAYRAGRDIVLIDQRGTGRSNGLYCKELSSPEVAYNPMLPVDAVVRCRDELSARADLRHYGTSEAVADLEAVRATLGYDKIDFVALSYGTTVALRYIAGHPSRVRAAVLMGTAPPTAMAPRHHATAGQRALDLLFQDCAADAQCRAAFPDPARDLENARTRLTAADAPVRADVFFEKIRSLMYTPAGARRVPWIISQAADGDFDPFFEATRPTMPPLFADGMFLSVTCSEGLALMPFEKATSSAGKTIFGDYRLSRQNAACAHWPKGEIDADFLAPVRADTAVLIISGHLDPVTPPEWGEAIRAGLPNSRHIIMRYSGHIFDGLSGIDTCLDPIMVSFLQSARPESIDDLCVQDMKPPPFKTGPSE